MSSVTVRRDTGVLAILAAAILAVLASNIPGPRPAEPVRTSVTPATADKIAASHFGEDVWATASRAAEPAPAGSSAAVPENWPTLAEARP